jgi:hypothetical protein
MWYVNEAKTDGHSDEVVRDMSSEDMKRAFSKVVALKPQDYDTFCRVRGSIASPNRSPIWTDIDRVGWFMNGLGFMVHRRFVSIDLIGELFGYGVVFQWKILEPLVLGLEGGVGPARVVCLVRVSRQRTREDEGRASSLVSDFHLGRDIEG